MSVRGGRGETRGGVGFGLGGKGRKGQEVEDGYGEVWGIGRVTPCETIRTNVERISLALQCAIEREKDLKKPGGRYKNFLGPDNNGSSLESLVLHLTSCHPTSLDNLVKNYEYCPRASRCLQKICIVAFGYYYEEKGNYENGRQHNKPSHRRSPHSKYGVAT
uniref:Uncharacterized protein n=1 Tax=Tanacetum cinerariifolium TaxID=118510 RepID=A0A6L2JLR9_TANCI|nr:hypothetical protein [Tanacetum cinerariifolium]